jgi:hypothetical protein
MSANNYRAARTYLGTRVHHWFARSRSYQQRTLKIHRCLRTMMFDAVLEVSTQRSKTA